MTPNRWTAAAKQLKRDVNTVFYASRHPDTPWWVKVWILIVVAYAVSPIDLIPDFIPILGYLDDLILVPLGLYIALKLIPPDVLAECRESVSDGPVSWLKVIGCMLVVLLWGVFLVLVTVSIS